MLLGRGGNASPASRVGRDFGKQQKTWSTPPEQGDPAREEPRERTDVCPAETRRNFEPIRAMRQNGARGGRRRQRKSAPAVPEAVPIGAAEVSAVEAEAADVQGGMCHRRATEHERWDHSEAPP
jgi:hypothetical protein